MTEGILEEPTGFSDPRFHTYRVVIEGYVHGTHPDAEGYGRSGSTALAIVSLETGLLKAVPIHWLRLVATNSLTKEASA